MSETISNSSAEDRIWHSNYVKLNVGGSLFYTTIGTVSKEDTMLKALFSGRMDIKTDEDGWVLLDRSGKHFGAVLNYLRDGTVPLPESRLELEELLMEARFYCIAGLVQVCERRLNQLTETAKEPPPLPGSSILIVKFPKATKAILSSSQKPVVKLTMNRYNNVFSYTSNSHDNLLRNIECLEKYALMFSDAVLFVKDVRDKCEQNEICEWSFFYRTHKLKGIDCIAIHYSSEKRLIKVEFPESRIHEEMLFLLSIASRNPSDLELSEISTQRYSGSSGAGPAGGTQPASMAEELAEVTEPEAFPARLPLPHPSLSGEATSTRAPTTTTTSTARASFASCRLVRW